MRKQSLLWVSLLSLSVLASCGSNVPGSSLTLDQDALTGLINQKVELKVSSSLFSVQLADTSLASYTIADDVVTFALLKAGESKITITSGTLAASCDLRVYDFAITGEDSAILGHDETYAGSDSGKTYTWSSSDPSIFTVSGGLVHPLKEGQADLTMTYDGAIATKSLQILPETSSLSAIRRDDPWLEWVGRTAFTNNSVSFDNEAAGFTVRFSGTSLKGHFSGWYGGWYGPTRLGLILDDESDYNAVYVELSAGETEQEYTLCENLSAGVHTLKVLKRTEAGSSNASLYSLSTDGYFLGAKKKTNLKLECYGDSISAGYGDLRSDTQSDGSNNEMQNVLVTYECVAAQELGADIAVQARSGIGLSVASNIVGDYNMNTRYAYLTPESDVRYNLHNYIPDFVIINLGTNDYWCSKFDKSVFVSAYVKLVQDLVSAYGNNTWFVLGGGLMEVGVYPIVHNEVVPALLKVGITNVTTVGFTKSTSNGHPLRAEHKVAGHLLANTIRTVLGEPTVD